MSCFGNLFNQADHGVLGKAKITNDCVSTASKKVQKKSLNMLTKAKAVVHLPSL